ncbi:MAG: 50S ribosomal protein L29 [Aminobacterium colombiense]|jgi:large subunit ribosomal protein L29|uniref:50S ribosomal protein L29 n=1 Tax=Aminobacterium TaxID=81466 RepID=UPI000A49B022|nr:MULTISPECIES: 50S ribosomal protein L29 [unclassified Aminobacterium]MDD2378624.1 50S ribosomal protein L29 [Aminobacterium colombiense]MDD3767643.1 50S ribosomal protein L29 [Aminobacterium colombiense]MDD4264927.1 50S ribosomal protein L29 [Aminobacterium colombiense]MDD4585510.1 50S ribosomal protein L29 [Aminobacterium colombiense]NLK30000.1 50S ribosomal protein L29 [Aminobacterium colombiense]
MDAKSLRDLTLEELQEKHRQYKEELFNLRFQNAIGQLQNTSRIQAVKKTIARVLTVVREKQQAESAAGRR